MDDDQGSNRYDVTLYPPGGAFNKLRRCQTFFDSLIEKNWKEYSKQNPTTKKEFIYTNILVPIQSEGGTIRIFRGQHPNHGEVIVLDNGEATEIVAQKLRDMKKRQLLPRSSGVKAAKKAKRKPLRRTNKTGAGENFEFPEENNVNAAKTKVEPFILDEASVSELKTVILSQWDHIDDWRRLCSSQKETIEKLTTVNARQRQILTTHQFGTTN